MARAIRLSHDIVMKWELCSLTARAMLGSKTMMMSSIAAHSFLYKNSRVIVRVGKMQKNSKGVTQNSKGDTQSLFHRLQAKS